MFSRRLISIGVRASAASVRQLHNLGRGVKTTDDSYEDDRWLEMELDKAAQFRAPEERYAAGKQQKILSAMARGLLAKSSSAAPPQQHAAKEKESGNLGAQLGKMIQVYIRH